MGPITLDDRDRAVLERLREGDASVETLAEAEGRPEDDLRTRLSELADNGLVRASDDGYALTDDGRRVLEASPLGARDDRIDTPPAVEERIESFDLRPDREDAVRGAFAFLSFWGDASAGEIVDAVFSEHPAGFDSEREWWQQLVRDRLADLPTVDPPTSGAHDWRYEGTPAVEAHTADGRVRPDDPAPDDASARFALEGLALDDDERAAVRAAFDHLVGEGTVTAAGFRRRVYPEHDAGYETASEWWDDCVRRALERLPDVSHESGTWRHRQASAGPGSTDPGAGVPEEWSEADGDDE